MTKTLKSVSLTTVLSISFLSISYPAFCQDRYVDSLQKYCYQIWVYFKGEESNHTGASCFFIKQDSKMFVVTANHVFSMLDSSHFGKNLKYKDTLFLILPNSETNTIEPYPISITNYFQSVDYDTSYPRGDFVTYEIKLPHKYKVNTINELINQELNYSDFLIDSALTFGYRTFGEDTGSLVDEPLNCYVKVNPRMPDSIYVPNNRIWKHVNYEYYMLDSTNITGGGFSGSPVFWIYHLIAEPQKHSKIMFGGLLFGGISRTKNSKVIEKYNRSIKPEIIINDIKRKVSACKPNFQGT